MTKTVLALGDYNFPFIEWPSRKMYSRDQNPNNMASEKVQGQMLLDWAESNYMEQYINTLTRKDNILDLVFSNSPNLINGYVTIVNKNFSDHNILKINLNYNYTNEGRKVRKNPFPNRIYEYDLLNASEEDWIRYDVILTKLSENFEEDTENKDTTERLARFYNIIENPVTLLFEKKEAFKDENEKKDKKENKIPKAVRIMLRKKTSLSKKIMKSYSARLTLKLMQSLEVIEHDLEKSYRSMRLKKEGVALGKIKKNPKYFYKYANSFTKSRIKVGPLLNEMPIGRNSKRAFSHGRDSKKAIRVNF